jgi:hypothetical protein
MVFNITFINISSWWSVLFVEETVENHLPAKSLTNFMKLLQCCIEFAGTALEENTLPPFSPHFGAVGVVVVIV